MKKSDKIASVARLVLGLIFFVFGLNGFLNFIPQPPHEGQALAFLVGLGQSGYFFPLLKGTEVLLGLALLANRWVPLALTVLAPITVNILAFHLFLEPQGLEIALLVLGLNVGLARYYRAAYRSLLASGAQSVERQSLARGVSDPISVAS
jgi:uncharacterized membrane protein YphA (DoxX/SURF4 family)